MLLISLKFTSRLPCMSRTQNTELNFTFAVYFENPNKILTSFELRILCGSFMNVEKIAMEPITMIVLIKKSVQECIPVGCIPTTL